MFLMQLRWNGRFGNRMFQYAYGATYARLTGREFWVPSNWEGTRLFLRQQHRVVDHPAVAPALQQADEMYEHTPDKLRAVQAVHPDAAMFDVDLAPDPYQAPAHPLCHANGCAFNRAIFRPMSLPQLRELFEFSDEVKQLDAYRRYHDMQGLYDVAHLRRDDICDVDYNRRHAQGYSVIAMDAYRQAFRKFGYDERDVEWVSDDYSRQWHTNRKLRLRGGWTYPTGSEVLPRILFDWLDDFLKLYFARTSFRANSSFSWWAAALSPTARVYSPVLDKRHIYGVDGMEEISVDFVEGNHPHWGYGGQYGKPDIVLGEQAPRTADAG